MYEFEYVKECAVCECESVNICGMSVNVCKQLQLLCS